MAVFHDDTAASEGRDKVAETVGLVVDKEQPGVRILELADPEVHGPQVGAVVMLQQGLRIQPG